MNPRGLGRGTFEIPARCSDPSWPKLRSPNRGTPSPRLTDQSLFTSSFWLFVASHRCLIYDLQQHTRHVAAGLAIVTAVLGVVAVGLPEHLYSYGLVDGQLTATNIGVFQVRS